MRLTSGALTDHQGADMTTLTCTIDGCERKHYAHGWCGTHYARWRKHGDARPQDAVLPGPAERFLRQVKEMPGGCIEWQGTKLRRGYGGFSFDGATWQTHRWAWTHANGPIPAGLVVRHKCDNPPCVNVGHLELGTRADNAMDMSIRGRSLIGSKTPVAKLDEAQVVEIKTALRDNTANQKELAVLYGISDVQVSRIKNGHQWKHVTIEAA